MLGGGGVLSFIRFVHFDFECHNRLYFPSYEWWITETNFEANKATKEQWGDGAQVLEQSILNSNDEKYFTSMVFASSDREWDGYYLESELKLRSFMAVRLTKPLKILFLSLCLSRLSRAHHSTDHTYSYQHLSCFRRNFHFQLELVMLDAFDCRGE